jgi:hypothetical protein
MQKSLGHSIDVCNVLSLFSVRMRSSNCEGWQLGRYELFRKRKVDGRHPITRELMGAIELRTKVLSTGRYPSAAPATAHKVR